MICDLCNRRNRTPGRYLTHSRSLFDVDRAKSGVDAMFCSPLFLEFVSSAKNASLIVFLFKSSRSMRECDRDLYSPGRARIKAMESSSLFHSHPDCFSPYKVL